MTGRAALYCRTGGALCPVKRGCGLAVPFRAASDPARPDTIKKHFADTIFKTTIPRNIRLAEAPSHGVPVGVYDRFSKGSRAYHALTKEIIERIEG